MSPEERFAGGDDGGDGQVATLPLPMDAFSVKARAAVELGQQSENALSYLDRKTDASLKATRGGTAWTRDQTKTGSVCQIVVRDTGFNMGVVLWRAVGLLVHDVNGTGDLHVVSTRSAFSDAFAVQYASCRFYKADGSAVRQLPEEF
ncbi:unnamed protein product [Laminaria digitata]